MSSVPEVKCTLHQNATGVPGSNYTMVLARGTQAGRVNDANGLTDQAHLCVVDGMEVSGPGVPAGTVVFNDGAPSGGLRAITITPPSGTNVSSQTGDIITFTLTQNQKEIDYGSATSFRNYFKITMQQLVHLLMVIQIQQLMVKIFMIVIYIGTIVV